MDGLFTGYEHDGFFDEMVDGTGALRGHYAPLVDRLRSVPASEMERRQRLRDAIFRQQGITFTVYGDDEADERTFPLDLVPRIIPAAEWSHLERGLAQRVTALNRFLDDLYVGEHAVVRDGVVPRWVVLSSDGFVREAMGVHVPRGARCLVAGIDVIRDGSGEYLVLEDNLRNPSGVSYVLENRATMTRVMPAAFAQYRVRPVDHYALMLLRALQNTAPAPAGDPCVVVLTPGVHNSAYFEHAFLARQMGVELVEGRDLEVDDHVLYMRTTRGRQRVDVVYRRIDDTFLDPVVFRADSMLGVPGLMAAARAGNVTIANAVGNGVADDKAVYPYVPDLIRYYLNEEPILRNVPTFTLWDDDARAEVLRRLPELVVKPVGGAGGYGMMIGPMASASELDDFRARVERNPRGYIAQETIALSRHPTMVEGRIEPRHVDLRPFVVTGEQTEVLSGGLTRVALTRGSLVVNSSQGGGSKDTWVLEPADWDGEPDEGRD